MTDHDADRPLPDLGFFAGAPAAPGTGPTTAVGAPPTTPFGAPTAFGTAGGPPVSAPPGAGAGLGSGTKLALAAAAVVLLVVAVVVGRFGWQQFVADPVTPPTLLGMPRATGSTADQVEAGMQQSIGSELTDGSKAAAALYTDGQGTGYLLMSVRGGGRPGNSSGDGDLSGWTKADVSGATCWSSPPTAAAGVSSTMCMRALWRRAVVVIGVSSTPLDPTTVARATSEAWDAQ